MTVLPFSLLNVTAEPLLWRASNLASVMATTNLRHSTNFVPSFASSRKGKML